MGENIEETRAASEAAEAQAAAPAFPNPTAAAAAIVAYYPELVDLDTSTQIALNRSSAYADSSRSSD